jgi:uridine kinase
MRNIAFNFGSTSFFAPAGTEFSALSEHFGKLNGNLAAVRADGEILPLAAEAIVSANLEPVLLESREGAVIHRHTLSFILCAAAKILFPERCLRAAHSLGNAYFFSLSEDSPFKDSELTMLRCKMDSLIQDNLPIKTVKLSFVEALEIFEKQGSEETARLLRQTTGSYITVNRLEGYTSLFSAPLLARTGLAGQYAIDAYEDGFLLRFPVFDEKSGRLVLEQTFKRLPLIFSVYKEAKTWARVAGVRSACDLNALVERREARDFIRIVEAYADKRLSKIADAIYERRNDIKLVLIAGPSSSGKTTTSKRLSIQLQTVGIEPVAVSLDDYYLPPERVPLDSHGQPDFECLESLDVPFLNEQLIALLNGDEVTLPSFDFKRGVRKEGAKIRLENGKILLIEGIHGLNDALTPNISKANKFKLYASALTQLNIDRHTRIATTDNRLLRRLVRDYQFRGVGAARTLRMWPAVQLGAEKHIFTFQQEADAVFNSALDYEIAVLKLYAEPLLRSVKPREPEYSEAVRLLSLLGRFYTIPPSLVPPLSTLREFIGDSAFKY